MIPRPYPELLSKSKAELLSFLEGSPSNVETCSIFEEKFLLQKDYLAGPLKFFLTSLERGTGQDFYDSVHVRDKQTGRALFAPEELADILLAGNYKIA